MHGGRLATEAIDGHARIGGQIAAITGTGNSARPHRAACVAGIKFWGECVKSAEVTFVTRGRWWYEGKRWEDASES